MIVEITIPEATKAVDVEYLVVEAGVRYWEDAAVNGVSDDHGVMIPFRVGDKWKPIIELETGIIPGWPTDTTADVHYKICDDGEYWLADRHKNKLAKRKDDYVPDDLLCVGDCGYGDYIILKIDEGGQITGWRKPHIIPGAWKYVVGKAR